MFGTHSAILQNLTVGREAVIRAGSWVVKNVAPTHPGKRSAGQMIETPLLSRIGDRRRCR